MRGRGLALSSRRRRVRPTPMWCVTRSYRQTPPTGASLASDRWASMPKPILPFSKIDAKTCRHRGKTSDLRAGEWVLTHRLIYGLKHGHCRGGQRQGSLAMTAPCIPNRCGGEPWQLRRAAVQWLGRVVGINSQIYSQARLPKTCHLPIPMDLAQQDQDQIVAHGKVEHASLACRFRRSIKRWRTR
jgi:hypothetical protein